jgi:hypothetical protein
MHVACCSIISSTSRRVSDEAILCLTISYFMQKEDELCFIVSTHSFTVCKNSDTTTTVKAYENMLICCILCMIVSYLVRYATL